LRLLTQHYTGDQIKKNMDGAYGTFWGEEKRRDSFVGETLVFQE
jgi:hypothetical protein